MGVNGDTSAIIYHTYAVIGQKSNLYIIGEAAHGLVARIVEDLRDKMMKAIWTGGANVHAGALAYWLKTL